MCFRGGPSWGQERVIPAQATEKVYSNFNVALNDQLRVSKGCDNCKRDTRWANVSGDNEGGHHESAIDETALWY